MTPSDSNHITVKGNTSILMPSDEDRAFYGVNKAELKHIRSLIGRPQNLSHELTDAIFFSYGVCVSGLFFWVGNIQTNGLTSTISIVALVVTFASVAVARVLSKFKSVATQDAGSSLNELESLLGHIENRDYTDQN